MKGLNKNFKNISKAYYVDSPIEGIDYQCALFKGITNKDGLFYFERGKNCKFYFGDILLKEIKTNNLKDGAKVIENNLTIAQFLLSLDYDGNISNGIQINQTLKKNKELKRILKEKQFKDLNITLKQVKKSLKDFNGAFVVKDKVVKHLNETRKKLKDKHKPIIRLKGAKEEIVRIGEEYNNAGAIAYDYLHQPLEVKIEGSVDTNKIGEYKIKYTAIDAVGNIATVDRVVRVIAFSNIDKNSSQEENKDELNDKEKSVTKTLDKSKEEAKNNSENRDKNSSKEENKDDLNVTFIEADEVDEKVLSKFAEDDSNLTLKGDAKKLIGNWYGKYRHTQVYLQLKKDGTFKYLSLMAIGKFYNRFRENRYEGKWYLANDNSQIILDNNESILILSNRFPIIKDPNGAFLSSGTDINRSDKIEINISKDIVKAKLTDKAKVILKRKSQDLSVPYFTMVGPKANSEAVWSPITPKGYCYGYKFQTDSDNWKYAVDRLKNDSDNYLMLISDESWQVKFGNRHDFNKTILDPRNVYEWLSYFKAQMKLLGKLKGEIIYIIAGDTPAYWVGAIQSNYGGDANNVPAKVIESRFPEALELNPPDSFAGMFQVMDYLRMKYAPNLKLGYTVKTWGIHTDLFHEPEEGWENSKDMQKIADYLNSYHITFDILAFNFNPGNHKTEDEYKSGVKYFGEISKHLKTREGKINNESV